MTLEITYSKDKRSKTTIDTDNPNIYFTEWMCTSCDAWILGQDAVWHKDKPYCLDCVPDEEE